MDDTNDSDEDNDFEGYLEEGYDDFQMIPFMRRSHSAMQVSPYRSSVLFYVVCKKTFK